MVIGSVALLLHGVDLGRAPSDLDLLASPAAWAALQARGLPVHRAALGFECLALDEEIEAILDWPGTTWARIRGSAQRLPGSGGLLVAHPAEVRASKAFTGRPKDRLDIAAIDRWRAAGPALDTPTLDGDAREREALDVPHPDRR